MKQENRTENVALSNVLIIDHDRAVYDALGAIAAAHGFVVEHASSFQDGLDKNSLHNFDLILMKDKLPDGKAAGFVSRMLSVPDCPEVIVFTHKGDPDEAEQLLNSGVWDYVVKPSSTKSLLNVLTRAIHYRQGKSLKSEEQQSAICAELQSEGIVGSSHLLQSCLNVVAKAAQSDANVLIQGESGTGKELFATAIHNISDRASRGFVVVDCTALPQTLVESVLFGHDKGAFTGADKSKPGLIKQADGGTLFLDEVGELPLDIQKRFLRVLQEKVFRPVGGNKEVSSNFRLIAATNKNLQELADRGLFREDLLFRLQTFNLELPPLRTRKQDVTELAYYYMARYCKQCRLKEKRFSPDFLMVLKQYSWPGNVRELFHALERSIASAQDSDVLFPMHLPTNIRVKVTREIVEGGRADSEMNPVVEHERALPSLQAVRDKAIAEIEKDYLQKLMEYTPGNIRLSCRISGLSRSRLYALLKKHQINTIKG